MAKLAVYILGLIFLAGSSDVLGLRILGIFPFNGKSHSLIQETAMKGLAARGHQVDVFSHFPIKKKISNFTHVNLQGTLPSFVNNLTWDYASEVANVARMDTMVSILGNDQCALLGNPLFANLLKNPPKYDLVVVEVFFANCYLALGRFLKAPMIGISATAVLADWVNGYIGNPINYATDVSFFSHNIPPLTFYQRLSNFFFSHYVTASANYYFKAQNAYVEKYFGPGYPDVQELHRDLSLVLLNFNNAIHGNKAFAPSVIPIGGIHVVEDDQLLPKEVQAWMDGAKSGFIYFTFGSMMKIESFPKPILEAFYETFRNIAPVKVLLKIANVGELPPGLPSNVMTRPWFSQVRVLKHKNIKMFVTHGGLLSSMEAIHHAVPLVGIPLFGDQVFNIKNFEALGNAIHVDLQNLTRESFQNAITEILKNPAYKENAVELAKRFKDQPMSPMETAVFWIEYIARNGKDALKLPGVDLPWWQNSLLDVYGFLLVSVLTTLYIVVKIIKCLVCCVCSSKTEDKKVKKH